MIVEMVLISLSLAMDAFAVSIAKGLTSKVGTLKTALTCACWFGFFQFMMPIFGWTLGFLVASTITKFSKFIAFIILGAIGANMIRETLKHQSEQESGSLSFKTMFFLAIATSIDALATGFTYSALQINILIPSIIIGIVAFLLSFAGCYIGKTFGGKFEKKATLIGGVILILIAFKILIFN